MLTGVEIQCIGFFKLLFSMMIIDGCTRVQQCTLEVINNVTANQECVGDIAASEVLANLLLLFVSLPKSTQLTLETLYSLSSNTKIVKEALNKGACLPIISRVPIHCLMRNATFFLRIHYRSPSSTLLVGAEPRDPRH